MAIPTLNLTLKAICPFYNDQSIDFQSIFSTLIQWKLVNKQNIILKHIKVVKQSQVVVSCKNKRMVYVANGVLPFQPKNSSATFEK